MTPGTNKKVILWTDGSNAGSNPGPGGWAAILTNMKHERYRVLSGSCKHATNNWAETSGLLLGLKALKSPCTVYLHTDSQYVINGVTAIQRRIGRYQLLKASDIGTFWKTNVLLWEEVYGYLTVHYVVCHHVDGHTGIPLNEWCDIIAKEAAVHQLAVDKYEPCIPETIQERARKREARKKKAAVLLSL